MNWFRLLIVLTFICGVIYPLSVTGIAHLFFSEKSKGSLIYIDKKLVGSELLAQKFIKDEFFHSRPSAADYSTIASGASQSSPTQKSGTDLREQRKKESPLADVDFWTTSGSGLDPHLSPKSIYSQVPRVAAARSLDPNVLNNLIKQHIEKRTLSIWGQPRVNVLKLNLELERKGMNANSR
jgi:K+-transporting ATPase ATPase C chain